MCIPLKICEIVFVSFCVFLLEHFDIFCMFLLMLAIIGMVIWFFIKTFAHFYEQIKTRQIISFIISPRATNPQKLSKLNKPKELFSFWEVKIFGWFTHYGYKRSQFRISYVSGMALYYTQYIHT